MTRCRLGRVATSTRSTAGSAQRASKPTWARSMPNRSATAWAVSACAVATATTSTSGSAAYVGRWVAAE